MPSKEPYMPSKEPCVQSQEPFSATPRYDRSGLPSINIIMTSINSALYVTAYKVAKTHRMSEVAGHFPQKSHEVLGSFAENDL